MANGFFVEGGLEPPTTVVLVMAVLVEGLDPQSQWW